MNFGQVENVCIISEAARCQHNARLDYSLLCFWWSNFCLYYKHFILVIIGTVMNFILKQAIYHTNRLHLLADFLHEFRTNEVPLSFDDTFDEHTRYSLIKWNILAKLNELVTLRKMSFTWPNLEKIVVFHQIPDSIQQFLFHIVSKSICRAFLGIMKDRNLCQTQTRYQTKKKL